MSYPSALDGEARHRAITDLGTTFLVEAGAGTGKTSVLLQRLLALVRTGRTSLDRIVAITFTEKAAAELRMRLRAELESALTSPLSDDERPRLHTARAQLEYAHISTVHAFCAALLRERPVEARVDPGFTMLDQVGASLQRSETWHEWLTQEMDRGSDTLKQALRAGLTLTHLETLRNFLVENRDALHLLSEPVASPLLEYRAVLTGVIARLSSLSAFCVNTTDRARALIDALVESLPANEDTVLWERLLLRDLPLNGRAGAKANWQPAATLDEVRTLLNRISAAHAQARSAWLHNVTVALARWLEGYVQMYEDKKREGSSLDFTDLLLYTRNLLAHNFEVRRYFQSKFDFLLVDEFQDTDPLQAEIVFFLAEHVPRATNWTAVTLRPGKLFLVGDPQQSIYRFRRADLEVYAQVRKTIERQGEVLSLFTNFRSRAPLLHWINATFAQIFSNTATDQPPYRALTAARRDDTGRAIIFLPVPEDLVSTQCSREEMRQAEARTVAAFLKQSIVGPRPAVWGDRQVRYRDIAILFRTYQAMEAYETAFKSADVPHRIVGRRRYTSRQEIAELRTLLRTIESPADTVALVATLRSSVFGFSDEELARFVAEGGKLNYLCTPVRASISGAEHFTTAFALLSNFHTRRTHLRPAALLHEIYTHTHLLPLFALRPHGTQRVVNLLKLIDIAHALAAQGLSTLAAFNQFLDQQDDVALEEEPPITESQEDTTSLLTIHKAKGLEFPAVILADAVWSHGNRSHRTGILERISGRLELSVGPRSLTCTTQGWQKAEAREHERDAAEEQRLWYVAAARVRDHLIIPFTPRVKTEVDMAWWTQGEATDWTLDNSSCSDFDQAKAVIYHSSAQAVKQTVPAPPTAPHFSKIDLDLTAHHAYQIWEAERHTVRERGRQATAPSPQSALSDGTLRHTRTHQPSDTSFVPYRQTHVHLGRAVHAALTAARRNGEEQLAPVLRQRQAIGEKKELDRLLENVLASSILARVQTTTEYFTEVPYILHHESRLLEGFIDLAFIEEGAWVLVKFITDRIAAAEQEAWAQSYWPQFCLAALALERLTSRPIKHLALLFAHSRYEVVSPWGERERAVAESVLAPTLKSPKEC